MTNASQQITVLTKMTVDFQQKNLLSIFHLRNNKQALASEPFH